MRKGAGKIGILDIQGSVKEHADVLRRLSVEPVLVKGISDFKKVKGLIIPGGESTAIGKLLKKSGLDKAIQNRSKKGLAVWGTCAGAILLAKRVPGNEKIDRLGLMDITVERNAYGRQLDSFETRLEFDPGPGSTGRVIPAVFIRAPKIAEVGKGVKVLANDRGWITAAREGRFLATTFHPELTDDYAVHKYFLEMCV